MAEDYDANAATAEEQPDLEHVDQKGYHDKSVQQRMNRPTPQQQRSAGREGGEDLESQTPVDRYQDQGASNQSKP